MSADVYAAFVVVICREYTAGGMIYSYSYHEMCVL